MKIHYYKISYMHVFYSTNIIGFLQIEFVIRYVKSIISSIAVQLYSYMLFLFFLSLNNYFYTYIENM